MANPQIKICIDCGKPIGLGERMTGDGRHYPHCPSDEIKPKISATHRCYHLNARINENGMIQGYSHKCPDCGSSMTLPELLNGWGDWLRENVFNKGKSE